MSRILRFIYIIFVVVRGCERLLVWVARFGFLIYPLYGIVSWFMTSRKERVRKRAALVEALFSVLAASSVSLLIRCIWHRPNRCIRQGCSIRHRRPPPMPPRPLPRYSLCRQRDKRWNRRWLGQSRHCPKPQATACVTICCCQKRKNHY